MDPSAIKRFLVLCSGFLLAVVLLIGWKEMHHPQPVALTPTLTGQTEYCLTCHAGLQPISPSHPVEDFGCVRCHGGERLALDANLAHSTLLNGRNPSDLTVVQTACGGDACHSGPAAAVRDQLQRVLTNLHTTYAGAIAAVRYAHGAQADLTAHFGLTTGEGTGATQSAGLRALTAFDPLNETGAWAKIFVQNCLTCHLSAQPMAGAAMARLTGCAACHTATGGEAPSTSHRLTTAIAYQQCNTCHNRGTYSVHTLQFQPRTDQPTKRQQDYYLPGTPMAKCEYQLDCVDCHTRQEIMGEGVLYSHPADAQYIQCLTCHGSLTSPPLTYTIASPTDLALQLAALNPAVRLQVGDTILVTARGEPLWNIHRLPDGTFEVIGKATGQHYRLPLVQGSACQQQPNAQKAQDCHVCHAAQP